MPKSTTKPTKTSKTTKKVKETKKTLPSQVEQATSAPEPESKPETNSTNNAAVFNQSINASTYKMIGLTAIVILVALVGYLYYRYWPVAVVNGKTISRVAYYQVMDKQYGKQTLDNLITETLIEDAAVRKGYIVDQQEIDSQLNEIETQMKSQGTTLEQALAAEGINKMDLMRQIRLQKIVEGLGQGDLQVSDDQIKDFLDKNKDNLPKNASASALRDLAQKQLSSQQKQTNIQKWLSDLRSQATIQYR